MLSTVARFALDPFHILLFLIAGMLLSHWFFGKRPFRCVASLTVVWFCVITTPFIPYAVLSSLESRYLPLDVSQVTADEEIHIVVLGAGYIYNEALPANSQLDREMLTRLVEGVRIHNQHRNSILIVSGPFNHDTYSQADVAKQAAMDLGVADSTLRTQSEGHTTHEEAQVYHRKFYEGQKLVVVTSALHMHRALGEFRRLGIDAVPSPSSYRYRDENGMRVSFMPSLSHVENMRAGMFEYAALLRNYVREGVN